MAESHNINIYNPTRQLYAVGQVDQDPAGSQNARASIKARAIHSAGLAELGRELCRCEDREVIAQDEQVLIAGD